MPNFIDVMDRLDMIDKKLNAIQFIGNENVQQLIRVLEVFIDEEEEQ